MYLRRPLQPVFDPWMVKQLRSRPSLPLVSHQALFDKVPEFWGHHPLGPPHGEVVGDFPHCQRQQEDAQPVDVALFASTAYAHRLYFCVCTILVQNGKCSPFLELTPTLWQMSREVMNISEDWADFCQCQEFWCHFLSLEKWSFWLWEGALSLSKSPLKVKRAIFPPKRSSRNDTETRGTGKSQLSPRKYSWRLVAFVKVWEWAREKVVNIFFFVQKWHVQK